MMSGGPMRKFKSGWAVAIFSGQRAHFFKRSGAAPTATSACGQLKGVVVARLRGAGSFKRCANCFERIISK